VRRDIIIVGGRKGVEDRKGRIEVCECHSVWLGTACDSWVADSSSFSILPYLLVRTFFGMASSDEARLLPGAVGPGRPGSSATGHPAVGGRHDGQAKQVPFHVLKGLQSTVPSFPVAYTSEELARHAFREATPDLFTDEDLVRNLSGPSVREFVGFVLYLNERVLPGCGRADDSMQGHSMQGHSMQPPSTPSRAVAGMVRLLRTVAGYVDEVPPLDRSQAPNIRFGNPAFRTWMSRIRDVQNLKGLMHALLSLDGDDDDDDADYERGGDRARVAAVVRRKEDVAVELGSYFVESFGNGTRIDYGTGHETCFVAMLFCRLLWSLLLWSPSSSSLSLPLTLKLTVAMSTHFVF